jgi:hypothetical protein
VTLVAYYGKKPPTIEALIRSLQEELSRELGSAFAAYEIEQVHATIIGLEAFRQEADILNLNFHELRGERRPMNLSAVLGFIDTTSRLPFNVQIGGVSLAVAYPFSSRGEHPYFRSFSSEGAVAVAMGWPISGQTYPMYLDGLRKCFNDYNVLHKYHRTNNDIDNDFFFVLGRIERNLVPERQVRDAQHAMREKLAAMDPVRFPVGREVLSLAVYEDPQLALHSTENISLDEARTKLPRIVRSYPNRST